MSRFRSGYFGVFFFAFLISTGVWCEEALDPAPKTVNKSQTTQLQPSQSTEAPRSTQPQSQDTAAPELKLTDEENKLLQKYNSKENKENDLGKLLTLLEQFPKDLKLAAEELKKMEEEIPPITDPNEIFQRVAGAISNGRGRIDNADSEDIIAAEREAEERGEFSDDIRTRPQPKGPCGSGKGKGQGSGGKGTGGGAATPHSPGAAGNPRRPTAPEQDRGKEFDDAFVGDREPEILFPEMLLTKAGLNGNRSFTLVSKYGQCQGNFYDTKKITTKDKEGKDKEEGVCLVGTAAHCAINNDDQKIRTYLTAYGQFDALEVVVPPDDGTFGSDIAVIALAGPACDAMQKEGAQIKLCGQRPVARTPIRLSTQYFRRAVTGIVTATGNRTNVARMDGLGVHAGDSGGGTTVGSGSAECLTGVLSASDPNSQVRSIGGRKTVGGSTAIINHNIQFLQGVSNMLRTAQYNRTLKALLWFQKIGQDLFAILRSREFFSSQS